MFKITTLCILACIKKQCQYFNLPRFPVRCFPLGITDNCMIHCSLRGVLKLSYVLFQEFNGVNCFRYTKCSRIVRELTKQHMALFIHYFRDSLPMKLWAISTYVHCIDLVATIVQGVVFRVQSLFWANLCFCSSMYLITGDVLNTDDHA